MASVWSLLVVAITASTLVLTYTDGASVSIVERPDDPTVIVFGSNNTNVSLHWNCTNLTEAILAILVIRYNKNTPGTVIKLATRVGSSGPNTITENFSGRGSMSGTGCEVTFVIFNVTETDEAFKYRYFLITEKNFAPGYINEISLDVLVPPSIRTPPEDDVVVENGTIRLRCIATGDPQPTITWSHVNNPSRTFPSGEFLNITEVNVTDAGEYRCTASSSAGSVSVSATITVIPPTKPSIEHTRGNESKIEGESVYLFCNASGDPQPSISWTKAGNNTVISVGNKLTLSPVTRAEAGSYVCTANNRVGTDTALVWLNVNFPPEISQSPQSITVNESDTSTLFCNASGNPQPTITWTKEGDENFNKKGETLQLTNIMKGDYGNYICTASNGIGQNATANATVTVQYKPRDTKLYNNVTNNVVERPSGVKFTCTADALPRPHLFQLFSDDNKVGETNDGIFELSSTNLPFFSTIRCVPHNIFWSGQEAELNLTVHASPTIDTFPMSAVYNETAVVTLFCNATGNPPPSITWTKRNDPRFKHTGETLTLTNVWKNNTGTYVCSASNGIGNNDTKNASIVVQYSPYATMLRSNVTNDTVTRPHVIAFNCTTDSNPPPLSYNFYKDNTLLGSSADGTYVISSDTLPYKTTIRCVPKNLLGTGNKAEVDLVVQAAPVMLNRPKNQTVNETDSIAMFCNASGNPLPKIT